MSYMFPYTGDDWAWGSEIGMNRLETGFAKYGGRYIGYLIVLILTRSNILKAVVMAFCLTGICICIEKLIHKKWAFYIAAVFLALLPQTVFRQAIVWTSGFSNYVTSIFLTLIYIVYVNQIIDMQVKPHESTLRSVLFLALGAVVEHMTAYNIVLSVSICVYLFYKYHKWCMQSLMYCGGVFLGTLIMLSNTAYRNVVEKTDGYRTIAGKGFLKQLEKNYFDIIYNEGFMKNIWINLFLVVVVAVICSRYRKQANKVKNYCIGIALCTMLAYIVYSIVSFGCALPHIGGATTFIMIIVLGGLLFYVAMETKSWKGIFWYMSIVCVTAPLTLVNPIGSRCFFSTYVMFICLCCEMAKLLPVSFKEEIARHFDIYKMSRVICITIVAFYIIIFYRTYRVDKMRIEHIRNEVNKGIYEIEILHYPYEQYIWYGTPSTGSTEEERYKQFYNLPAEISLIPVWEYSAE